MGDERKVLVWGKPVAVTVHQESKKAWIASGQYLGEAITVKAQSQASVLKLWRARAVFRGNA